MGLYKALLVATNGIHEHHLISLIFTYFLHLSFYLVCVSLRSLPELQKPTGSREDWVEWVLYRLHQEPWALGGLVVIGVFVLGILSLVAFALLYGCCCGPREENKKKKKSGNGVI